MGEICSIVQNMSEVSSFSKNLL